MVWQVNATINGRFNCQNASAGADIYVQLASAIVAFLNAPQFPSECNCPACTVNAPTIHSDPSVLDDLIGKFSN